MSKFRIKTALLRALLGAYRGLGYVLKYVSIFFLWIFRGFRIFGRPLLSIAIAIYRIIFSLKRYVLVVYTPLRGTVLTLIAHRNTIHFAIITITFVTAATSLGSRAARAEELGTRSILFSLVSDTQGELIEEGPLTRSEAPRQAYLVDVVAVSEVPDIDFTYDETAPTALIGGRALEAPSAPTQTAGGRTSVTAYTVAEGDTISQIAERFGLSVNTLLWANGLTVRSFIRPGDELTIPPVDGIIHTVKRGDTISQIAKTYQTEAPDILAWNKIGEDEALQIGESLMIPGGKIQPPPVQRVSPPSQLLAAARPPNAAAPADSRMLWPTPCRRITQYFGWRHTGVDIACPTGTAVYASADGIVELSGWSGGYGNAIVINHGNGLYTRYGHASKLYVKKGDKVTKGETIMAMGSTGYSTGPHVHFEVMIGGVGSGKYRNPFDYVR